MLSCPAFSQISAQESSTWEEWQTRRRRVSTAQAGQKKFCRRFTFFVLSKLLQNLSCLVRTIECRQQQQKHTLDALRRLKKFKKIKKFCSVEAISGSAGEWIRRHDEDVNGVH